MSVTRRRLLEALATTGALGASAGCLSALKSVTSGGRSSNTATGATTDPGPQTLPERDLFDGTPCRSFTAADRTVCWHTHDDGHEVAIQPSTELYQPVTGNDTVETITFTLANTRDAPILFNPHSWTLKRKTDDGWVDVAPDDGAVEPLYELDPGASYEWVLSSQEHPNAGGTRTISATVDFENGRHAFVLTGTLADSTPNQTETVDESTGASVEWVTLFEVQQIHD